MLWNAVLDRARVSFTYRDGSPRTLEPWGLTSYKGRWYVIGRDVDRDGQPDVQAVADDHSAQEGLASRRRIRCRLILICAGSLERSLRGSRPRPRCLPSAPGKAPALARRGELGDR